MTVGERGRRETSLSFVERTRIERGVSIGHNRGHRYQGGRRVTGDRQRYEVQEVGSHAALHQHAQVRCATRGERHKYQHGEAHAGSLDETEESMEMLDEGGRCKHGTTTTS